MDLLSLKPDDTATIDVLHPTTGEALVDEDGVTLQIVIYGEDSKKCQAAKATRDNALSQARRVTAELRRQLNIDLITVCTHSLVGKFGFNGAPVESTPEGIRSLYENLQWLYDQINVAIADRAHFLRNAPKVQSDTPNI